MMVFLSLTLDLGAEVSNLRLIAVLTPNEMILLS